MKRSLAVSMHEKPHADARLLLAGQQGRESPGDHLLDRFEQRVEGRTVVERVDPHPTTRGIDHHMVRQALDEDVAVVVPQPPAADSWAQHRGRGASWRKGRWFALTTSTAATQAVRRAACDDRAARRSCAARVSRRCHSRDRFDLGGRLIDAGRGRRQRDRADLS